MNSRQIIIGCPKDFELSAQLHSAISVNLAMAFAKRGGWDLIKDSLLKDVRLNGEKTIKIIVGLHFGITDPKLLDEWLVQSDLLSKQFEVRVAPTVPVFHPKVVIVHRRDNPSFAIVGSGNLTEGGQVSNVECGAYIENRQAIIELQNWYNGLRAIALNDKIIELYRPIHAKAVRSGTLSVSHSTELAALLNVNESGWYESSFLEDLAEFLSDKRGRDALKDREAGAKKIEADLDMPNFDFTSSNWKSFYSAVEFGSIRPAHLKMADEVKALKRAFRLLFDKPVDVHRLESVWDTGGSHHVLGLGRNQISKILTVGDRSYWPVLNARVEGTLLYYGYKVRTGAKGYLELAEAMRNCLNRLGKIDFWAMDAFCEAKSRDIGI